MSFIERSQPPSDRSDAPELPIGAPPPPHRPSMKDVLEQSSSPAPHGAAKKAEPLSSLTPQVAPHPDRWLGLQLTKADIGRNVVELVATYVELDAATDEKKKGIAISALTRIKQRCDLMLKQLDRKP